MTGRTIKDPAVYGKVSKAQAKKAVRAAIKKHEMIDTNGQEIIKWLQNNKIARIILAETYAIKCEQAGEEDSNGEENTYDKLFSETLDEIKSMEIFQ